MSYSILYDKVFLATTRGITPLILSGDNNVYERTYSGRERRARNWGPLYNGRFLDLPANELIKKAEELFADDADEIFMYRNKWIGSMEVIQMMQTGVKTAVSLEQLQAVNPHLSLQVYVSVWPADGSNYPDGSWSKRFLDKYIRTTDELEQWIDVAREFVAESTDRCYFVLSFGDEPISKPSTPIDGSVLVKKKNMYLCQHKNGHSSTFSSNIAEAIVFESVANAQEQVDPVTLYKTRFVKAGNKTEAKAKKWVLRLERGSSRSDYFQKKSRSGLHPCRAPEIARHFATENAAQKYYDENIKRLYPNIKGCTIMVDPQFE
jgi:hypothetical protein